MTSVSHEVIFPRYIENLLEKLFVLGFYREITGSLGPDGASVTKAAFNVMPDIGNTIEF